MPGGETLEAVSSLDLWSPGPHIRLKDDIFPSSEFEGNVYNKGKYSLQKEV